MNTCNNCGTDVSDVFECSVCKYPIGGNEKEQAEFIAKQIIQKSDVLESIQRLKKSRFILFVLGAFNLLAPFTPIIKNPTDFQYVFSVAIGVVLIGFGFLTFKKPKLALLIPLTLILMYYVLLFFMNPMYLLSGLLWKMIIVMGLGYGYLSVRKSDVILKENEYLASVLGFGK